MEGWMGWKGVGSVGGGREVGGWVGGEVGK